MILSRFKWWTCLVYIDDVIIFSTSIEDHVRHVDEILTALEESGGTLKISKFYFLRREGVHIIKPGPVSYTHLTLPTILLV